MDAAAENTDTCIRFEPPFLPILLILLLLPFYAWTQPADTQTRYVLYLVDTSYSMGLKLPGQALSQPELTADLISESIRQRNAYRTANTIMYGLAEFSGTESFRVRIPFTPDSDRIIEAVSSLEYWYNTDLDSALRMASDYLLQYSPCTLILISDGIDTDGELYALPDWKGDVDLEVLQVPLPLNEPAESRWKNWISKQTAVGQADVISDHRKDQTVVYQSTSRIVITDRNTPSGAVFPTLLPVWLERQTARDGTSSRTLFPVMLLLSGLVPAALYFIILRNPRTPKVRSEHGDYRNVYRIRFRRRTSGNISVYAKEYAENKKGEIRLKLKGANLVLTGETGRHLLKSPQPILIDGVAATHRLIHEGSRIVIDGVYYTFLSIEKGRVPAASDERQRPDSPKRILSGAGFLPFASAVFLFILVFLVLAPANDASRELSREVSSRLVFHPYDWYAEFVGGTDEKNTALNGGDIIHTEEYPTIIHGRKVPDGWLFEGLPEPATVDLLCFHAHPDDESIDFGGILAQSSLEGKKTAVVLFTDGESGLSRGPNSGALNTPVVPLRQVRIQEAGKAMAHLGVDYYIRLGRKNHPYSSQQQVMPIEDVYREWGGYGSVKSAVLELIERIQPVTVAAPDGPSRASEHFEHDAVGYLVAEALDEIRQRGGACPATFLTSVDPLQQAKFSEAQPLNMMKPSLAGASSPRAIQHNALQSHASQLDARIIALEFTPLFEHEYYLDGYK